MASHRPYRPARGVTAALAELSEHAALYDAEVVSCALRLHEAGRLAFLEEA
jgi:HD-GYP domain-containing protein (c-di-GMP phosphodiesterase class II)